MGGKGGAPAAPDYSQLAASSTAAAKIQAQTSQDQLDWAKSQYADMAPVTKSYMQSQVDQADAQRQNAATAQDYYTKTYQPIETQFAQQAQSYASPARADERAAQAEGDVASQFDAQRKSALTSLESYGIDPSQTRYGALDLGTRVSQAAATAAAGTQSRQQSEAMGMSLEGEAINIGRGYPGQVAQSYAGATASGAAGIQASNQTASTYGNLMGTATQWGGLANQSTGTAGNMMHQGFADQLAGYSAQQQASSSAMGGIGSLVGGVGALAVGAVAI